MKKYILLFLLIPLLLFSQYFPDRSRYVRIIRTATGQLVTGLDVDLYDHGTSTKRFDLSETSIGEYSYDYVEHGQYDLYVDGVIETEGFWVGANRMSIIGDADHFNTSGKLLVGGIQDSVITLAKFTTAAINYIGSGGSITNNPDDITLENKSGSTLGTKADVFIDSLVVSDTTNLKTMTGAIGRVVTLKELSSGHIYGGGDFIVVDSSDFGYTPNAITIFDHPDNDRLWVRVASLEKPKFFNVLWAGAVPDYSADSQPAFQRVSDEIFEENVGGMCYIPSGKYKLDTTVTWYCKRLNIVGEVNENTYASNRQGGTPSQSLSGSSMLLFTENNSVGFKFTYTDTTSLSCTNNGLFGPTIKNLVFRDYSPDTSMTALIEIETYDNTTIQNCGFFHAIKGKGIFFDGGVPRTPNTTDSKPCYLGFIQNCSFVNCRYGVFAHGQVNLVTLTDFKMFKLSAFNPYPMTGIVPGSKWRITNGTIELCDTMIVINAKYSTSNRSINDITIENITNDGSKNGIFIFDRLPIGDQDATIDSASGYVHSIKVSNCNLTCSETSIYDSLVNDYQGNTYVNVNTDSVKYVGTQPPLIIKRTGGIDYNNYVFGSPNLNISGNLIHTQYDEIAASTVELHSGTVQVDSIFKADSIYSSDNILTDSSVFAQNYKSKIYIDLDASPAGFYHTNIISKTSNNVPATGSDGDTLIVTVNYYVNYDMAYFEHIFKVLESGAGASAGLFKVVGGSAHNTSVANRYHFAADTLNNSGLIAPKIEYWQAGGGANVYKYYIINQDASAIDVILNSINNMNVKSITLTQQ